MHLFLSTISFLIMLAIGYLPSLRARSLATHHDDHQPHSSQDALSSIELIKSEELEKWKELLAYDTTGASSDFNARPAESLEKRGRHFPANNGRSQRKRAFPGNADGDPTPIQTKRRKAQLDRANHQKALLAALKSAFTNVNDTLLPEISARVLGMNVTVHSLRISDRGDMEDFAPVRSQDDTLFSSPATILQSKTTSVRLTGRYRSQYRTTREGDFQATLSGFRLVLSYSQLLSAGEGEEASEDLFDCHPTVDQVEVKLSPPLLDDVDEVLRQRISEEICTWMCRKAMKDALRRSGVE